MFFAFTFVEKKGENDFSIKNYLWIKKINDSFGFCRLNSDLFSKKKKNFVCVDGCIGEHSQIMYTLHNFF